MRNLKTRGAKQRKSRLPAALFESLESRTLLSTTYYVAPTGNDGAAGTSAAPFQTIQYGVQFLTPGDTLDVRAGTYAGFIIGWDPPNSGAYSSIAGTAGAPITIQADPAAAAGSVVINNRNNKTGDAIDLEDSDNYVTVKGFTITNAAGNITRDGIRTAHSDHVSVIGNSVDQATRFGVFCDFADYFTVQGNTVTRGIGGSSTTGHGMYISNSSNFAVIKGNTIANNYGIGIHFNGDISEGGSGMISNVLVEGNIIHDNGANGINGDGLTNSVIEDNLFYNNAKHGIVLYQIDAANPSTGNLIVNNTFSQGSSAGAALEILNASTGNTVYNNVLLGGSYGTFNISTDSLPGLTSDYNVVGDLFNNDDTGDSYTLAQWRTQTGKEMHSIIATPAQLFVNPGSGNYHLLANSPAIDAGTNLTAHPAPTTDLEGNARPSGANWDIGAYEISSGPDTTPPTFSSVIGSPTSPTSATITWSTNELSDSQVLWGTTTGYGQTSTLNTSMLTAHSVALTGLLANTTYHFEVRSRDAAGNLGTSSDFTFITPAADTTKPTASLTAADITTGGGTTYSFTVTFSDNMAINVATLGSTDLQVTGPNGFSQTATFVSVDTNTNGTPRVATYSITAAGGTWDISDNGTYTVAVLASQVADTSGNYVTAGSLGTFNVAVPDTTKPTASLTAANVISGGGTTYSFTVTYSDNAAINIATIDSSDVKVTGPNSFTQTATLVSVDVNSNGTPRTATYRITAPGGTWDGADNGTYTVKMVASQVADTSGNFVASGTLGTFTVNLDATAPTAALTASNVTTAGGTTYSFTVTYSDNVAINVGTLGSTDVTVTGPNSFSQTATFVSVDTNTNGTPRTATYQITPPGGTWNKADNGTYTINVVAGQVTDTSGNAVAAGTLGTFTASVHNHVAARGTFYATDAAGNPIEASDKSALLPGQTASSANSTSYVDGITGVTVDIDGSVGPVTAADFQFKVGNTADSSTWVDAPAPASVVVQPGLGVGGGDRIVITWNDGAIRNQWLQVTVLATANTGLAANDVFSYGNLSGDANGDGIVDFADFVTLSNNFDATGAGLNGGDFNNDGVTDFADFVTLSNNYGLSIPTNFVAAGQVADGSGNALAAGSPGTSVTVDAGQVIDISGSTAVAEALGTSTVSVHNRWAARNAFHVTNGGR